MPLTFDNDECTECGFVCAVTIEGVEYTQWVVHKLGDTGYEIHTAYFKGNGQQVTFEDKSALVTTGLDTPLFALIRPAIDNTHWDHSPFGASIFDRALGAVKLADGSFDNTWKDIFLGQKLLFVPEEMIRYDENGNATVPRAQAQQLFMSTPADRVGQGTPKPEEYNPDLRVDDNRKAIDTGLALLGKRCGFGFRYYSLDDAGGLKTAREVVSDNAELLRNAKKHEKIIGDAIETICTGAVALANKFCDVTLADVSGKVSVLFGDTVIEDESAGREMMRADVAAGFVPDYKYTEKYYGVDEATAKSWVAEAQGQQDSPEIPPEV